MLKVEISCADMWNMELANDLLAEERCNCAYSLARMRCPWRPNTWEKVAWLQVRMSSMVVPRAHAEEKRQRRGMMEGQPHCVTSGRKKGKRKRDKKMEGEGEGEGGVACLQL